MVGTDGYLEIIVPGTPASRRSVPRRNRFQMKTRGTSNHEDVIDTAGVRTRGQRFTGAGAGAGAGAGYETILTYGVVRKLPKNLYG